MYFLIPLFTSITCLLIVLFLYLLELIIFTFVNNLKLILFGFDGDEKEIKEYKCDEVVKLNHLTGNNNV